MLQTIDSFSWTDWGLGLRSSHTFFILAGAYFLSIGPLKRSFGNVRVERNQVVLFSLGLLSLFIVLVTPLAELSNEYLLSAHIIQVMVVTLIAVPLMLLGTPEWMLRPLFRAKLMDRIMRVASKPMWCFLIFTGILVALHLTYVYNLILENELLYHLEHWVYFIAAVFLWWPSLSPLKEYPRLSYAGQMLYVIINTFPSAILGIFITFEGDLLYEKYASAPLVWGLSHEADQEIAGLTMWVGGGTYFLLLLTTVFFVWFDRDEKGLSKEPGV